MEKSINQVSMSQFKEVIDILNPCMDDYLYIFDIKNDQYCISPNALMRFRLPSSQFSDVVAMHEKFVYPDDIAVLQEDLNKIISKKTNFHNLQYRWLDKKNQAVWINCRGSVIYDDDGEPEYLIGCINEIGRKQKADNISGLLGESSLQQEIEGGSTERLKGFILRLGIDNFKEINENRGMDYGDMVLHKTAECIDKVILPEQKLYKIVADEFIIADFTGRMVEDAIELYDELRKSINEFIEDNCYEVFYTVSAGILDLSEVKNQTYVNLMKLSEFSLNEAKIGGKNRYYMYLPADYNAFLRNRDLLHKIRQAVNADFEGFETHFQPIMGSRSRKLEAAETLLRFHNDEIGNVSPVEFIPLLEESGLIIPVGKWVLYQAMQACKEIQTVIPHFRISVNVSYIQVLKSNMLETILEGLEKYELSAGSIMIELTESGFLEANENFTTFCEGLKKHGIGLALDDFGTGYSNFHYLSRLNPNTIKIDRSFTLQALHNDYEYNLLQHMVNMTHSIQLKLCIEGIETESELEKILQINPDYIQGYFFGKPCNLSSFEENFVSKE